MKVTIDIPEDLNAIGFGRQVETELSEDNAEEWLNASRESEVNGCPNTAAVQWFIGCKLCEMMGLVE